MLLKFHQKHALAMAASKEGIHEFQIQSIIEGFFVYGGTSGWPTLPLLGVVKMQPFCTIL